MIGIVVYEDNEYMRESIAGLISGSGRFELKGSFENCDHVARDMKTLQPGVVLMDIEMEGTDGLEGLKIIRQINPGVHVIMLTIFDDNDRILAAICAGASGYLLKSTAPDKILDAIDDVQKGGAPMTSSVARKVLQLFPKTTATNAEMDKLTTREKEVLQLLVKGNSYKMIAAECGISIDTVRTFIKRIYEKLQVHSATEAIAKTFLGKSAWHT